MLNPDFFPSSCKLSGRVAVYVPSTVDADHAADNSAMVEYTAAELSRLFGGATAQPAAGYWLSEVHGLIAEAVTIVYSNARPDDIEEHAAEIAAIIRKIKHDLRQEAVSCEINNDLYIL